MTLNGVMALIFNSPNSVASGAHCVKVVEDVFVKSSRSLSHLMSFLSPELWRRNSPDFNSSEYTRFKQSYSSMSISCE